MSDDKYSLNNIVSAGNWSMSVNGQTLCLPSVIQETLSNKGKVMYPVSADGLMTKPFSELLSFLEGLGAKKIYEADEGKSLIFLFDDKSYLDVDYNEKDNYIKVTGYNLNPELKDLSKKLEENFTSKVKKNLIFSIVKAGGDLNITSLGDGSSPLIEDNYTPDVITDVKYVVDSFKKSPPVGRICILNGDPGSGKTHLIKSILKEIDCVFLIVPSNMIEALDKPEFLPLLLKVKKDHEKPIIMIIEDGDVCLVPRKSDNISTISSLLNLSDGILGSIIDIKLIITTNAEIRDMDKAIMRTGRLCKNIHVGPLPYEQANKAYQRLSGKTDNLEHRKSYTLAEVYAKANNQEEPLSLTDKQSTRRIIGFSVDSRDKDLTINKLSDK